MATKKQSIEGTPKDNAKAKDTKVTNAKAKDAKSKDAGKSKDSQKKPGVFKRIGTYFHNVRLEIKRTTWPTRPEVLNMSLVVVAALLFFGVLIFAVDSLMTEAVIRYSALPGMFAGGE
jgi:preprotein translocase subunit SecE